MTTTPSSTPTTIQIRRAGSIQLLISYDYTALENLTLPFLLKLQSSIDQAIEQWWNGLSSSQKSGPLGRGLNLKISASYRQPRVEQYTDNSGNPVG
jgi:hypothetical protein